jgi:hypothetical protein
MIVVVGNIVNKIAANMPKNADNIKPKIAVLDLENK